jgi:hypothetical protein
MKIDRQINRIIETYTPDISSGQETIASILEKYPQYAHELRPRLESVSWLVNARKNLEPRDNFISSSRMYIEDQFETVQPQGFWRRIFQRYTPQRWVFNFAAPVVLVLLLALIINSLVLTARLSIPGDPFYSTKLAIEDIQLAFTFNREEKTDLYIQFSRERTTEFVQLVLEGDYQNLPIAAKRLETDIIATLHSLNIVSLQKPRIEPSSVNNLRVTLSSEILLLNVLKDTSPTLAHPGIDLAIQVAQTGILALH